MTREGRIRERLAFVESKLKKLEDRKLTDWEEGYHFALLEEHEWLWQMLNWWRFNEGKSDVT